ncbi:PEP-CTERM sorting domain-containing protein [Cerasicoccus fimbriatus]|uniref:PEP-CTERM sorting domain-containing protein n=1 Tax=Cerasicoccus fimbriatus TaxID=3014554 RepID=UPI0022B473A3|nr:PEP-CTERM sorting domain-containing protein [Cerasicoccus sp. TK19100]
MKNYSPLALNRYAVIATGALLLIANVSSAVDLTWNLPGDGNWNTTDLNWDNGGSSVAWSDGNAAIFDGFAASADVTLQNDIVATNLTRTSVNGDQILRLYDFSIDVSQVTIVGTGDIDLFSTLTGDHDFTLTSDNNGGRLNIKTAASYTGDTFLQNNAYFLSDGVSNALPVTTTLNMTTNTTFRMLNVNQELAGLEGRGTIRSSNATLTINTKTGAVNNFNATIQDNMNLVVTGDGSQRLFSTLNYTGTTTVSGGTLILGNNLNNSSAVIVNGGDLQNDAGESITLGSGNFSMSSGSITPGGVGAAGTLNVATNQNFTVTGGTLNFDVGTDMDQILGSGSGIYSIEGATIALSLGAGFDYENSYELIGGFASGTFGDVTVTGYDTANYVANLDNSGGALNLSFAAIPEPSEIALILGGLMGVLAFIKRRR